MNKDNLISIVLPVYNGAAHIEASIQSIISQTHTGWELIIVNDCSTDDTPDIINKYADSDIRIHIINNKVNLKLPASLNAGFAAANGNYLTWTSDDNLYKSNALSVLLKALKDHPESDMVYSNYTNIDDNGNELDSITLPGPDQLVMTNTVGASFLYTRRIFEAIGEYDTNLFLAEDYDYWMRIYANGAIMHIDDDLYLYRRHSQSLTETKKELIQKQTYKALMKNFLPMYATAVKTNQRNQFFDHIIMRAGEEFGEEARDYLLTVCPAYRRYLHRKKLRNTLKSGNHG